jgi:hypothetical protein
VVLAPGSHGLPQGGDASAGSGSPAPGSGGFPAGTETQPDPAVIRAEIEAAIRVANRTLAVHQRVAGWRLWPDADFPRTHTLKVKRDQIRVWAAVEAPLPVHTGS